MKAAGLAWDITPRTSSQLSRPSSSDPTIEARLSATAARRSVDQGYFSRTGEIRHDDLVKMPDPSDYIPSPSWREPVDLERKPSALDQSMQDMKLEPIAAPPTSSMDDLLAQTPPVPPEHAESLNPIMSKTRPRSPPRMSKPPDISYRREYPPAKSNVPPALAAQIIDKAYSSSTSESAKIPLPGISRKPLAKDRPADTKRRSPRPKARTASQSDEDTSKRTADKPRRPRAGRKDSAKPVTPPSTDDSPVEDTPESEWDKKLKHLLKNLPKGVDEGAAKQVLNEIVVKGDEVHWDDVAGLAGAKKALKEAVVYPFLRPDLFMGLREPARGMLLFGPPGTGKTMLARAVATESKSTFFAISASSLTSKWHGESEKLVRALFALAKALAPSIIFVDEIDSLLSARSGSSEHEASRRSKTEFLIQWSDLQRAAAGKESTIGDPSRVLVLAATNCPWDIDDAARRRFVRRQYIPLPEAETRETQIRTLLGYQKHDLDVKDIHRLVRLTEGMLNCV